MLLTLFASVSDAEMRKIHEDVVESRNEGIRPRSLDQYIKTLRQHCEYETMSQAVAEAEKLFYRELADRYFSEKEPEAVKYNIEDNLSYDKEIDSAIRGMKNLEENSNSPRVKMNCTFAKLALQKQVQLNEILEYWKAKNKYEMILVSDLIDTLEELKID